MTSLRWGVRFGLAALGAGTMLMAAPVAAQTTPGPFAERPGDALSRNLRSLAANPKSVTALMGAGKAALDLGDAQAALTFFARAEEQLPRDGRIKMWIGSALAQLQQPHAALKFFRDATDLGVAEAEVAGDRGLAYDLLGNPRQAQRDYRLALQRGRDGAVARRLALSLAISGEREPALRLLEDQLLLHDRAAERARALVLALTGDTAGAARAVQAGMPGPQASAMTPFLARLPTLSLADRALAVHLGVFPGDGRTVPATAYAANGYSAPAAVTEAGRPDSAQGSLARHINVPEPVSSAPRRRPGSAETAAAPRPRGTASRPERGRGSGTIDSWSLARGVLPTPTRRPAEAAPKRAEAEPPPATSPSGEPAVPVSVPAEPEPKPVELAAASPAEPEAAPAQAETSAAEPAASPPADAEPSPPLEQPAQAAGGDPAPATTEPKPMPAEVPAAQAANPPAIAPGLVRGRLADLSAAIAGIDESAAPPVKPKPAPRAAAAAAKPGAQRAAAAAKKPKPAPPADPARIWVQVAGGANRGALPREFARLKAKAPKLLGSRAAWTTVNAASNRLLVGPFAGAREAQAFVNQLKAQELSGFAWTSAAGQKVEKLPAK